MCVCRPQRGRLDPAAGGGGVNPSETIISEKYAQQIDEMLEKLQRLQLALVDRRGPILLGTAHTSQIVLVVVVKRLYLGYHRTRHI